MSVEVANFSGSIEDQSFESSLEKQHFGHWWTIVGWALRLGGIISDCIVLDVLHSLQNPGSTLIWGKYHVLLGIQVSERAPT